MRHGKWIAAPLVALAVSVFASADVSAESYLYTRGNEAVEAPSAYTVSREIPLEADGVKAVSPQDIFYSDSGKFYIVDTNNDRIIIYDSDYEQVDVLSSFALPDGTVTTLHVPEGIYVDEDETMYIADTGNNRILKCDSQGNVLLQIEKPENLTGVSADSAFNPIKLSVDTSGRIYVVARNYNLGILQLDAGGSFVGYMGAPKVQYNIVQMLWRRFSTQEQLAKMEQYVPTEYNNIAIDEEGFVYGTIGTLDAQKMETAISSHDTSGSVTPIKKLNTMGSDVLKRNGFCAPMGDLEYETECSKIVDVAYTAAGMYAMLDAAHGHIFVYDSNGNLLCAFGGSTTGDGFARVSSFTYAGDSLLVLDAQAAKLFVYEPTTYGRMVFDAVSAQYNGDFDEAYALWSDVAACNRNFEYAFVGLGQSYLSDGQYEQAMECFRLTDDKENYSRAKQLLRKENMKTVFPVIFISILCIVSLLTVWRFGKKVYRYVKGEVEGS